MPNLPISRIKVRSRYRKNLGDIQSLAASIQEVGLLHPIVVRRNNRLIAGERRLQACKLLGWKNVPVRVIDIDQIVRGEFAENAFRMDFLPSEVDAIRRALEPLEKAAAKERMSNGGKGAKVSHPLQDLGSDWLVRWSVSPQCGENPGHHGASGTRAQEISALGRRNGSNPEG
jgi:ParB-like nuclease domain